MEMWEAGMSVTADRLGEWQGGLVNITVAAGQASGTAVVTFPKGAFAATPVVLVGNQSGASPTIKATFMALTITPAGFTARVDLTAINPGTFPAAWFAFTP